MGCRGVTEYGLGGSGLGDSAFRRWDLETCGLGFRSLRFRMFSLEVNSRVPTVKSVLADSHTSSVNRNWHRQAARLFFHAAQTVVAPHANEAGMVIC